MPEGRGRQWEESGGVLLAGGSRQVVQIDPIYGQQLYFYEGPFDLWQWNGSQWSSFDKVQGLAPLGSDAWVNAALPNAGAFDVRRGRYVYFGAVGPRGSDHEWNDQVHELYFSSRRILKPLLYPVRAQSLTPGIGAGVTLAVSAPWARTLTYSATGVPANAFFDAVNHRISWEPKVSDLGTHSLTFTVRDGAAFDTVGAEFTVTPQEYPGLPKRAVRGSFSMQAEATLSNTTTDPWISQQVRPVVSCDVSGLNPGQVKFTCRASVTHTEANGTTTDTRSLDEVATATQVDNELELDFGPEGGNYATGWIADWGDWRPDQANRFSRLHPSLSFQVTVNADQTLTVTLRAMTWSMGPTTAPDNEYLEYQSGDPAVPALKVRL